MSLDHGARLKVAGGERDRLGLGVEVGLKLELDDGDQDRRRDGLALSMEVGGWKLEM